MAEDIGYDRRIEPAELRELLGDERSHADVLQPDRVDHPAGRLADPRRRRSGHGLCGESLHNNPAEPIQIYELREFDAVPECPARRNYWIF